MSNLSSEELALAWVPGTAGAPYAFGHGASRKQVQLAGFYMGTTPVTQAFGSESGDHPAVQRDPRCPVENVSWKQITAGRRAGA